MKSLDKDLLRQIPYKIIQGLKDKAVTYKGPGRLSIGTNETGTASQMGDNL